MFNSTNLPQMDGTTGAALKTRPMLATVLTKTSVIPAPWGGQLTGHAGIDAYMVQAMENGKGVVDAYFNKTDQMKADYQEVGDRRADQMSDEDLAAIFEDLPERLAHIRSLYGPDAEVLIMRRTAANQTLLGRAQESGTFQTHEGEVEFDVGAYINQDSKGRVWPIDAATFARDYTIV